MSAKRSLPEAERGGKAVDFIMAADDNRLGKKNKVATQKKDDPAESPF